MVTIIKKYCAAHPMIKVDVVKARHEARMKALKAFGKYLRSHMITIMNAIIILAFTALIMCEAYIERGYFALGGEVLIPGFALIFYLAEREMKRESKEYNDDSN